MREILLLLSIVVVVCGCAFWLRKEVRKHVNRLLASGCPMAGDMEARLAEIDLKLTAQESKTTESLSQSARAMQAVEAAYSREKRESIIKTVPAHKQRIHGDVL